MSSPNFESNRDPQPTSKDRPALDSTRERLLPLEALVPPKEADRLPASRTALYSNEEISARMQRQGFPELARSWTRFLSYKLNPSEIEGDTLDASKEAHKAPLGGRRWVAGVSLAVSAGVGAVLSWAIGAEGAPTVTTWAMTGWGALNFAFLGLYAGTIVKRYGIEPFEKLMALDLARMLSKPDFRGWFEGCQRTKETDAALRAVGVTDQWDNPEYKRRYRIHREGVTEIPMLTPLEAVSATLKEFLGSKDPIKRRFVPGRYLQDLKDGKRSVSSFVERYAPELELARQGRLSLDLGKSMLSALLDEYVRAGSDGARTLALRIKEIEHDRSHDSSTFDVQIWRRDPWVDLTHQEEFFSSASLRGAKLIGRGPKGRLGTFDYHYNRSISALDFSSEGRRIVRARLGATFAPGKGGEVPILFVDGVEGSGVLSQRAERSAIEDYAKRCGFKAVLYNAHVHNQTPKKFLHYLERAGVPLREVSIRYADSSAREYLDSFGLPLEPFEYAKPRGTVVGHLSVLDRDVEVSAEPPRLGTKVKAWLKENCLWCLVGQTVAFEIAMCSSSPEFLVPVLVVSGVGLGINHWFQRRSLRRG